MAFRADYRGPPMVGPPVPVIVVVVELLPRVNPMAMPDAAAAASAGDNCVFEWVDRPVFFGPGRKLAA